MISSQEDFHEAVFDPSAGTIHGKIAVRVVFEHDRECEVTVGMIWIQRETANVIRAFVPAFKANH